MITGDNPLTAAHVARDVEIVDRDVMILDLREGAVDESGIQGFERKQVTERLSLELSSQTSSGGRLMIGKSSLLSQISL